MYYVAVESDSYDPETNTKLIYIYEHLNSNIASQIPVNTSVVVNSNLGQLGNSGSTSPHLHFQINRNNVVWGYAAADTVGLRKFYDYMMGFTGENQVDLITDYDKW